MPKRRMALKVRLPPYRHPRNTWRGDLLREIVRAQRKRKVRYVDGDRLEVQVRLYLPEARLVHHDVDNRVKDVLDALQGRLGGPKSIRPKIRMIHNDRAIYRLVVEKSAPPGQSLGLGHLTIRKLRG